jgi:hypothetical protein
MKPELLVNKVEETARALSNIISLAEQKRNINMEQFIEKELSPVLGKLF